MKYVRRTLKLFALSSIALTGIMCSQKNETESDADAYFASRYQDDIVAPCGYAAKKIKACRIIRNACWDKAHNKYLDTGRNEAFDACYDDFLKCIEFGPEVCDSSLKTIKAFVLDTLTDGQELGEISPELAWDGTANMGGVEMADKRCQALAEKNKISGTFKAFLSSSKRDFYKEINPKYLNLPFENVHGTILTGNVITLDDLRISNKPVKNTSDGMWDSVMFFRANGQRIKGCNFPSNGTYDVFTGMGITGNPLVNQNTCNDWTSNMGDKDNGIVTAIFDKGASDVSPIEPLSGTSWKKCMPGNWSDFNVLKNADINYNYCSSFKIDGLFCVQVEK